MKRVVREQRLGFFATVNPDGTPNLSPKGTTAVWDDDHLVFADIASPGTVANLRRNPAVEVNVVDQLARKGYRFKGTATLLADGEDYERAIASYDRDERVGRDLADRIRHVVLIRVEYALPVLSPAYAAGETEEELVSWWRSYWTQLWDSRG